MNDVTRILADLAQGAPHAAGQLLPLVYEELRKLAAARMADEAPGHTLNATALVHEAFLRLVGEVDEARWDNRGHFFAAAAEAMRRILIERARHRKSLKAGGEYQRVAMSDIQPAIAERDVDLLALNEALETLGKVDPLRSQIVELRFFGGLTIEEAAQVMRVSTPTVERGWRAARAWLQTELG